MIQRLQPAYFFALECYFLYLLVFLFYTRLGEIPSVLAFLVIMVGGNSILFLARKQRLVNGSIPFISATLLGGACYLLGLTPMTILLCTVFLYFRIDAFIKDSSLWKEERTNLAILFYTSSCVIFFVAWIFRYPHMNILFGLVIGFAVLYSVGRFLQQMGENNNVLDVFGLASVLSIAVLLSGIGTLLVPVVKWVFFKVFSGLAIIASILGSPIFSLIENIVLKVRSPGSPDDPTEQAEGEQERTIENFQYADNIPPWFWIALLIMLLVVIWFIVKKKTKMVDMETHGQSAIQLEHIPLSAKTGRKQPFFRDPAPQEYIRKLIYQLDSYANKHHLGRYHHETIREWFQRVGFQKNEELFLAYEGVRYGNMALQRSDASHLEKVIHDIKQDIKERSK
jgi:hypothetical protein